MRKKSLIIHCSPADKRNLITFVPEQGGGTEIFMDIKKESITLNETVMRTNEKVLVSGDIIVPDIKSDMAKILRVDADAVVDNCTYSGGKIEVYGKICLTVLYVPENDTKPVCSISTDMPFETQIENDRLTDGVRCVSFADVFNIEFNMLNARKLSVRSVVDLDIRAIKPREEEFIVSMDNADFEVCDETAVVYSLSCFTSTKFELNEVCDFPQGKPSGVSLLKTDVKLLNYQTHVITGKIVVKGMVECCSIYVTDANKIEYISHEIPFSEVIDADGANEDSMCDLDISQCITSASLKADADGDMRLIELSILFSVGVMAYEQAEFSLVSDCFSCSGEVVCSKKDITLEKLIHKEEMTQSIKGTMSLEDNMPPILEVYNFKVKPYVEQINVNAGEVIIEGSCDCYALYISDKESSPVCCAMSQVPFSFSVNINEVKHDHICDAKVNLENCSYNFNQTGDIDIRIGLSVVISVIEEYEKSFISDIAVSDNEDAERRHGMSIYFAKKGDSLWNIAKKYKIPVNSIVKINKLENPDMIQPGQPILIPLPFNMK